MFDKKSDFSLNKANPDTIICPSVTGIHTRLVREDFSSEEEFLFWKQLSDSDYKNTEKSGRNFYDHCVSLSEALRSADTSVEDAFVAPIQEADWKAQQVARVEKIKKILTKKQYRRLWMFYVDGKTVKEIASLENVTPRAINLSLAHAIKMIVNKL